MRDTHDLANKMVHQGQYARQEHNNPNDKSNILDALNQFQEAIKDLDQNASVDHPDDALAASSNDVKEATDKLLAATHSIALNALDDFNIILDSLRDLSEPSKLDLPAMQVAALDFFPASEEVIAATIKDPVQLKNIQAAVPELSYAIKNVLNPTKVLLLNPIDATLKDNFVASLDDVGDILSNLQATVQYKDATSPEKRLWKLRQKRLSE